MPLNVTTEPKENRQLAMTIVVEQSRVDQELRKAARKVAHQVRIPGFRRGKVPYHVLVQQIGVGALFEEFVDDLGQELYKEAIEQESIEPYAIASLDNIEMEPLRYTLTIPLAPEVELGDYRSLRLEEEEVEVNEEMVQAQIDQMLEREASYQDVDRPTEYGDLMTVDVRAVVLDDEGNETDTVVLDEEDWDLTPDDENPMEPAGFDEALTGLNTGEEKSFEIAWPEDSPSMYAGKNVRFHVTVHNVQAYQKPALTDELAQTLGEYETAEELVNSIRESIAEESEAEQEGDYLEQVLDELVSISELTYPPAAVELQLDQMMNNTERQMQQMGLQGLQQFLQLTGQSMEEYRAGMREQAEDFLKRNLVLAELAEQEKLTATDDEIVAELEKMLGPVDEDATEEMIESRQSVIEMMSKEPNRQPLVDQIVNEKAVDRLLAIARGEEVPEPGADAPEADAGADEDNEEAETEAAEPEAAETEEAEAEASADSSDTADDTADDAEDDDEKAEASA